MDGKDNIIENFISDEDTFIPNKGKYSSFDLNFYTKVNDFQKTKPIEKFNIKPIQFTFEITNRCNCHCPDCGMSANSPTKKEKLTLQELYKIIDELEDVGIMSYAITGGEPFLEFDNICNMIEYSQCKLDIIKLISNGFWGKDPNYYFTKMIDAGLLNNKFVKPSIYISIGEQDIKLDYICNLIKYFSENLYGKINFGIINTRFLGQDYSQLEKMYDLYIKTYGSFPKNKVYLTNSIYVNNNKLKSKKINTVSNSVYNNIQACDNRFEISIGKFVSPKIFMKVNGDCYPCEVFNLHKNMYLGNFFDDGIYKILENYNNNIYVKFINKYGTSGFIDVIPNDILENTNCETTCSACEFCIKFCDKYNLLNMEE